MKLTGSPELIARLKATRGAFKVNARKWAGGTAELMRPQVPSRTGRLRRSFGIRNATQRRAVVGGWYTAYFIDAGTIAHPIKPRGKGSLVFKGRRGTVFARRVDHPRTAAHPFRARMAQEGLRQFPITDSVTELWNGAA